MLFGAEHPHLGGPLPPTVDQQTTVTVDTDVVVTVADPAGVTRDRHLDGHSRGPLPGARPVHACAAGHHADAGRGGGRRPSSAGAPATGASGSAPAAAWAASTRSTRCSRSWSPPSSAPWDYRTCWCASTPTPTAARPGATALAVIAPAVVVLPVPRSLLGVFARLYVPQLLITGKADAAVLLLPAAAIARAGPAQLLGALVAAGAIAAFLATSSGLLVSIAGALSTDVLRGRVRDFRVAALIGRADPDSAVAGRHHAWSCPAAVGLAFAVAASTLCPLLVLGIWWRGLTAAGAMRRAGRSARWPPVWPPGRDHRLGRRRRARRLARDADRLPRRHHRAAGVRDDGARQPAHPGRRARPTWRASSPACTCRSAWAWAWNAYPRG